VAFAVEIFDRVEQALGLPPLTVKIGIMDEERRTSANLKECIRAAKDRVAFINTGFLDRTGDEIHTSMEAGPMVPKGDMKREPGSGPTRTATWTSVWLRAAGRAQIGKGMWAMPDRWPQCCARRSRIPRRRELRLGARRPRRGAARDALHLVDVAARQEEIARAGRGGRCASCCDPGAGGAQPVDAEVQAELDNNVQASWAMSCAGSTPGSAAPRCPTSTTWGLMEDRATCRISSQALANWLHHGVVDEAA
jgi:malate synthase